MLMSEVRLWHLCPSLICRDQPRGSRNEMALAVISPSGDTKEKISSPRCLALHIAMVPWPRRLSDRRALALKLHICEVNNDMVMIRSHMLRRGLRIAWKSKDQRTSWSPGVNQSITRSGMRNLISDQSPSDMENDSPDFNCLSAPCLLLGPYYCPIAIIKQHHR